MCTCALHVQVFNRAYYYSYRAIGGHMHNAVQSSNSIVIDIKNNHIIMITYCARILNHEGHDLILILL